MLDKSSGTSWELKDAALRRLHDENGDDIMAQQ